MITSSSRGIFAASQQSWQSLNHSDTLRRYDPANSSDEEILFKRRIRGIGLLNALT